MSDRLLKESDVLKIAFQLPLVVNSAFADAVKAIPSADRPQGDVDAVAIFMREEHNLEQGYITIGEFDERIEPLRHLCYDRPQGKWVRINSLYSIDRTYRCSVCGKVIYDMPMDEYYDPAYKGCPYCLVRMKGADDES